jgi:hypothetical protein
MVMAETQSSPEFCSIQRALAHPRIRQDSAACVSLSSNHLSKSEAKRSAIPLAVRLAPLRREEDETLRPVRPGEPRVNREIAAHWSHTTTWRAREAR